MATGEGLERIREADALNGALAASVVLFAIEVAMPSTHGFSVVGLGALWALATVGLTLTVLVALGVHRLAETQKDALTRAATVGASAALAGAPIAVTLFSGPAIRTTVWRYIGPPLICVVFAGGAALLHRSMAWRRSRREELGLAAAWIASGAVALVVERSVLAGAYLYLHVAVAVGGGGLIAGGLSLALPRVSRARLTVVVVGAAWAAAAMTAFLFPEVPVERTYVSRASGYPARVAAGLSWLIDFDRDGVSAIWGGGDCDDFDAGISPLALEIAGNGTDENCDGKDYLVRIDEAALAYRGDAERADSLAEKSRGRPTVVIVVDALRADRVSRFPNLKKLAERSIAFEEAYAPASSTALSVPAMLVGHPLPHPKKKSAIELLGAQGVATALCTTSVVTRSIEGDLPVPMHLGYPFTAAFERASIVELAANAHEWGGGVRTKSDTEVTDRAMKLLGGDDAPQLLWVHYYDLHQWMHLDGLKTKSFARYDEVLSGVDREIGRWLDHPEPLNLILTSDHGEALGQHDLDTHTKWLFRELVQVPLLVSIPGVAAESIDTAVAAVDIAPTLLHMLGADDELRAAARAKSLLSVTSDTPATRLIAMYEVMHWSLHVDDYRYVVNIRSGNSWLFNHADDAEEKIDVAPLEPERARAMHDTVVGLFNRHQGAAQP